MSYNTYPNPNRNFGRSFAFSEYLNRCTPDQKRKIVAAENMYLKHQDNPTGRRVAEINAFADSFKGCFQAPASQFPEPQALDPALAT
jgi:hypothetical protein